MEANTSTKVKKGAASNQKGKCSFFSFSIFYIMSENNEDTVENISIKTNEEILQFLLAMCYKMGSVSTVIKYLVTWRVISHGVTWCHMEWQGRIRESEHHENQNDAVSSHEGHGFYKEMESSPKKTKTGASRRPTDILSWTFRAFRGHDENTSFQEIARQVKDDIKSLVGQIVSKQRDNSYWFDSLTIWSRTKIWWLNPRKTGPFYPETFLRRTLKIK